MLAQKNRLTKTKDIDLVFKKGKSAFLKTIGIKVLKNDLQDSRIAVLVSTKVSKKAVKRNLLKRRVKAILKELLLNEKKSVDIVVITKPGIEKIDFIDLKNTIEKLLKKLRLI